MNPYYTPEEDRRLKRLYRAGRTYVDMADALGRSVPSICVRLKRLRKQVAIPPRQVRQRIFTPDLDRRLTALYHDLHSYVVIAEALGCTPSQARNRSVALGLPPRPRCPAREATPPKPARPSGKVPPPPPEQGMTAADLEWQAYWKLPRALRRTLPEPPRCGP